MDRVSETGTVSLIITSRTLLIYHPYVQEYHTYHKSILEQEYIIKSTLGICKY